MTPSPTSKRLAKNSALMYVRMFILMLITLYTARIVLAQLGIANYGIYSVVGSVLAIFNSLRSIFASSTQRFLNYEMGQGQRIEKMCLVFNLSIKVNLVIILLVFILLETVGVWFINFHMNIDTSRVYATNVVFQISVISSLLSILNTTFDAEIIAHERMDFYAYMSIFEGGARLLVVYLLAITHFDKLIFYSQLMFTVSLLVYSINIVYCYYHFPEVRLRRVGNKQYFKEMTKFAGWNFFGNTAFSLTQNVMNMILNVFGGTVVNAARGISYQVKSFFDQFVSNVSVVLVPYSIKTYATGEQERFYRIIILSSKILFFVQFIVSIILIYLTVDIFQLWLGQIPKYSVGFTRLIMVWLLIRALHNPIDTVFKAVGDLKQYQLTEIFILTTPLLITYLGLKFNADYNIAYISMIICEAINLGIILFICHNKTGFNIKLYFLTVIIPCSIAILIGVVFYILIQIFEFDIIHRLLLTCLTLATCSLYMYYYGLNKQERSILNSFLPFKNRVKK